MFRGTRMVAEVAQLSQFPRIHCRHISKIGAVGQVLSWPSHETTSKVGLILEISRNFLRYVALMPTLNQRAIQKLPLQRGVYVAREEDKEIETCFRQLFMMNPNRIRVMMLHGPGGYGKTSSAGNFVSKLYISRLFPGSFRLQGNGNQRWRLLKAHTVRWTLDASNANNLLESYCDLAAVLGLQKNAKRARHQLSLLSRTSTGRRHHSEMTHHANESAIEQALKPIYQAVMRRLNEFPGFVLIVDGANDEESKKLVDYWPRSGEVVRGIGLVVITTQDPRLLRQVDEIACLKKISVSRMNGKDAVALLKESCGIPINGSERPIAEDIAVRGLNCNPQDIAAFGRHLSEHFEKTGRTISYSKLQKLLKERKGNETDVIIGLPLLLHMMREKTTEVFKLLACCSDSCPVPIKIIEEFVTDKSDLLNKLKESEFLEVRKSQGVELISLHSRQHKGLRSILNKKPDTRWSKISSMISSEPIPAPSLTLEDIDKAIDCLSKACKGSMQYKSDHDYAMIRWAHPHLKDVLEVASELGFKDKIPKRKMAGAHACLGGSYLFVGASMKAVAHLEEAQELFGHCDESDQDFHLQRANVLHFLGEAYGYRHLGKPSIGEQYLRDALQIKEKIFGKELESDPEIALTLTSLANLLNEEGRHYEAIECLERANTIFERLDNDDDNHVQEAGFVLSGLGSSYRFLGKFKKAEELLKRALEMFESLQNPSDLRVGVTLSRLASVQRELGQLSESIASLEEAKEKFGNNDEYKAVIYSKLSVVHRYRGEDELSEKCAMEAKSIIEETFEKDLIDGHPGFATACLNLGHAMSDLGKTTDALKLLTQALKTYETLHGESHRTIATTLNYIGSTLLRRGKVSEAKATLERSKKIMTEMYDSSHPGKGDTLKRLSKVCRILGELPRSAALAQEAFEVYQKTFNSKYLLDHRELRKCKTRSAKAYSNLGCHKKALEIMHSVCKHIIHERRENHPENIRIQRTFAEVILDRLEAEEMEDGALSRFQDQAGKCLEKALSISATQRTGERRLQTGLIRKQMVRRLLMLGDTDEAYRQVMKSLDIVQDACLSEGEQDHCHVAHVAVLKSDVDRKLKQYDENRKSLLNALETYKKEFGGKHPSVATTLLKLCCTSLETEKPEEAQGYYDESEKICDFIREDLHRQIEENKNKCEDLRGYNLDKHPLFRFRDRISRLMPKQRQRKAGEWRGSANEGPEPFTRN